MKKKLFKNITKFDYDLLDADIDSLRHYINTGIIKKIDSKWVLSSMYRVGTIVLRKYYALLQGDDELSTLDISFSDLNGAKDGDFVLVKRILNPKSRSKGRVVEILSHSSTPTLVYKKDASFNLVSHFEVITSFNTPNKYIQNDVLLVDLSQNNVIEFIGNFNDSKIDEKISMTLFGEDYRFDGFSQFNLDENEDASRVDLTYLPFCTIDPPTAKDHDDAIYYDESNNTLYVAIADVSYYVKSGTTLDIEASKRATSIYLPHCVYPMLPPTLSEDLCSLKPDVIRKAFVFEIAFAKNGLDVEYSKLYTATIKSRKKYSYDEIDDLITGKVDENGDEIFIYLMKFYRVSARIRRTRLKNGFDFDSEELRLILDDNMNLKAINIETSTPSHSLIEEAMLLANTEAAKILKSRGIFRNHPAPSQKSIDRLVTQLGLLGIKTKDSHDIHKFITAVSQTIKDLPYKKEINELLIKSQQLATYNPINLGHFGLGFKAYSHFTSPIRRYADLVLHRILKSKQIPKSIEEICEHINIVERKVDELVWDYEERKFARWAVSNIGLKIQVMMVDVEHGIVKSIDNMLGIKMKLLHHDGEGLFEKIIVQIVEANVISKIITVQRVK